MSLRVNARNIDALFTKVQPQGLSGSWQVVGGCSGASVATAKLHLLPELPIGPTTLPRKPAHRGERQRRQAGAKKSRRNRLKGYLRATGGGIGRVLLGLAAAWSNGFT